MKILKVFLLLIAVVFANNASAYGSSGSSKKACNKPRFSQFTPPYLSNVSPNSDFSFTASASTIPDSIQVSIKKKSVAVNVSKKNNAFLVTGKLPDSLKGTYARINIQATGPKKCIGKDGWLLNIIDE